MKEIISEMREMAELLIPHCHPKVSVEAEKEIQLLNQRIVIIDGYEIKVFLSMAEYDDHKFEYLRMQATRIPFLPFNLVCKIARLFLGDRELSYIDILNDGQKIYCWTLKRDETGNPVAQEVECRLSEFEGFSFSILDPKAVHFH